MVHAWIEKHSFILNKYPNAVAFLTAMSYKLYINKRHPGPGFNPGSCPLKRPASRNPVLYRVVVSEF
jgi:hypothetical protein